MKSRDLLSDHYREMEGVVPGDLFLREFSVFERVNMYSAFMEALDWLEKLDKVAFHLACPQIEKFLYQDTIFPLWALCDALEASLHKSKLK